MIFCLCSGYGSYSLCVSLSCSVCSSELFGCEVSETFAGLSSILFSVKSPVTAAGFLILFLKSVLSASVAVYLAWSKNVLNALLLTFLLIFLPKDKNHNLFSNIWYIFLN